MSAGRIVAVCLGAGGIPKHPVAEGLIGGLGLEGDRHRYVLHGGPDRALCLLSVELTRELERDDVPPAAPGGYGENLLTEGLDLTTLRPGDLLDVGDEVRLQLSDVREPCKVLQAIDPRFPDLMLGRSGWMARVLSGGRVRPGDEVRLRTLHEERDARPVS